MKQVAICGFVLSLSVLASPVAGQQRNPVRHTITGSVVDEQQEPVSGARICAEGTRPMGGVVPCSQSDAKGEFSIGVEYLDTYTIYAEHFQLGYPNASWSFYGNSWRNFPKVTIDDAAEAPPAKIQLGPKAGRLVLTILDGSSNRPIEQGSVQVCRLGEPSSWWSIGTAWPEGHFEILTPEVPFTIKFQTKHGEWIDRKAFDEQGLPVEIVNVDLGARKEMTIRLY